MSDIEKIIGILIDGTVYSGFFSIEEKLPEYKVYAKLITLSEAEFMSASGSGENWDKLSKFPVLFKMRNVRYIGMRLVGEMFSDDECLISQYGCSLYLSRFEFRETEKVGAKPFLSFDLRDMESGIEKMLSEHGSGDKEVSDGKHLTSFSHPGMRDDDEECGLDVELSADSKENLKDCVFTPLFGNEEKLRFVLKGNQTWSPVSYKDKEE